MDKIIIKNAKFKCNIGITDKERRKKQEILIDVELFFNIKNTSSTNDIKNTIDYSKLHEAIRNIVEKKGYNLIETLAESIAKETLSDYLIKKIIVRVKKPEALRKKNVEYAAVEITRKKNG
jgi:dihydroneopterin aldolase